MKTKKHAILDHPILGYFLLAIFALLTGSIIGSFIDSPLAYVIPGYGSEHEMNGIKYMVASGVGNAIGALLCIGIFYLIFKPSFDGMLKRKGILKGLLLLLPFLVFHWAGSIVSWVEFGTVGTFGIFVALLRATAPGFLEEVTFRGLGVANYMRRKNTDKGILVIFWLSSFVFGAFHLLNIFAGAPEEVSLVQAIYAMGVGMSLAAVYLRTGSLWPTIIAHTSVDFMEFVRADLGASGGVMLNMGIGDWVTIAAGAFAFAWGLILIRRSRREDIIALWDAKWNAAPGTEPAA